MIFIDDTYKYLCVFVFEKWLDEYIVTLQFVTVAMPNMTIEIQQIEGRYSDLIDMPPSVGEFLDAAFLPK